VSKGCFSVEQNLRHSEEEQPGFINSFILEHTQRQKKFERQRTNGPSHHRAYTVSGNYEVELGHSQHVQPHFLCLSAASNHVAHSPSHLGKTWFWLLAQ